MDADIGKNRHYEAEHIQRRHFNSTARRLGFGEDAAVLLQDFVGRTPNVVEQVQCEVPAGFSQLVLNEVLSGLLRAATVLSLRRTEDVARVLAVRI